jgi:NADPH-dependent 2,4-dienoyl-CoA reductase/sulfur reductase-like enzyme/nitrite reductase/ring-hydroxylating ferredoxin subunit
MWAEGADMSDELEGPDLTAGLALADIADGAMVKGHAHGEAALLARRGDRFFAIGATCTHYGASLADGLVVGDTVRCPWHHACFNLSTGQVIGAPALDAVSCWHVDVRDGRVAVGAPVRHTPSAPASRPESVVIVGGGAAGNAAAEMLRHEGYDGPITMISADTARPCDRPNLSKGYLSGAMSAETNPLRSADFYSSQRIDLKLGARVASIDTANRQVILTDGTKQPYGALLLATGAEPVRLDIPGIDRPHVHYLRTEADSRAIVERAGTAKHAVVIGASFIGLEVAASLRARDLSVTVVAPETVPMEKVLGPEVGAFIRGLHERHGVTFHLGTKPASIQDTEITLDNGTRVPADLVVVGVGVRPAVSLADETGLTMDRGVRVNEYLETSAPGVFAAGDIARWPDRLTGDAIRVEHWVVAERQGQTAARNILGRRQRFDMVPFFWTEQYDFTLAYIGHAERWDAVDLDGQLDADAQDCTITWRHQGRKLAVAVVQRDLVGLEAEAEMEKLIRTGA